jgi:RNA polymerase sigma-70 factor (ECF subfamily)
MSELASENAEDSVGDRTLVVRFVEGDREAASEIYRRYARRLQALAVAQTSPALSARVETDDIVQSIFRTFFRRAGEGAYIVPDGEELWKLLLVIALNKIRNLAAFHTAAKRDVRRTVGGELMDRTFSDPTDERSMHLFQMVVDEMLEKLPEDHQQVIRHRIEGLEVSEIAQRLGHSKRTVERVLQGFRNLISNELTEDH